MAAKKILVIEDDLFFQTYVNDLLSETDFDVINASDGEQGLALARSELPDIILTDIEIPKVQGFVLLRHLKESSDTSHIPIVMMSGKVERDLLEKHAQLRVHADGYLLKPFSGKELEDMLSKALADVDTEALAIEREIIEKKIEALIDVPDTPEPAPVQGRTVPVVGEEQFRVLVVDDSDYVLDTVSDFLEHEGMIVHKARDGEEGLNIARETLPDLVLLDGEMPSMDGFVVCENLKKDPESAWIPVAIMSAVVDDESLRRQSSHKHRADAYIQKPFKKAELLRVVHLLRDSDRVKHRMEEKSGVELKTDFLLPTEIPAVSSPDALALQGEKLKEMAVTLKSSEEMVQEQKKIEQELLSELSTLRRKKDDILTRFEASEREHKDRERQLTGKLTLATRRVDETGKSLEHSRDEDRKLKMDLEAALLAKREIEDQAKANLESHSVEMERASKDEATIEKLSRERGGLAEQLNEKSEELKILEKEWKEQKLKLADMRAEHERLESGSAELKAQMKERAEEISRLKDINRELEENRPDPEVVQEQEKRISSVSDELNIARERIRSLGEERDKLADDMAGARKDASEASHKIEQIESDLAETRKIVTDRGGKIEALDRELENQQKILADQAGTRMELEDKVGSLEEKLAVSEAEAGKVSNLVADLERGRSTLEELEKKHEEETKKRALAESDASEVKEELKKLAEETETKVGELTEDLEKERGKVGELKALEGELIAAREKVAQLQDLGEKLEIEQEKVRELQALGKDLQAEREKVRELQGTREKLEAAQEKVTRLEESEEEIKEERERIKEIEDRYNKLLEENKYLLGRLEESDTIEAESLTGWVDSIKPNDHTDIYDTVRREFSDRLDKLESVLERTVTEAQTVLVQQKERETRLEEKLQTMIQTLEEERAEHRHERDRRRVTEDELKKLVEDSYQERMKTMGEEMNRLYPMHIKDISRPLEVATGRRRITTIAIILLLALLVFFAGYLTLSSLKGNAGESRNVNSSQAVTSGKISGGALSEKAGKFDYEELWRKQTVQSVSEDMRIQATLHSREELQASIQFSAESESWTGDRLNRVLAELFDTFELERSFYVTVFTKNLKDGYPGYANILATHLALRDQAGNEVEAVVTEGLADRKFIMSYVASAGKEANPVFLYEVGITVAFPRKGMLESPEKLQLVLYDVGDVPLRVLTWDLSGWKAKI
ncbi:MAG: response regulator [bacterium]